MKRIEKGVIALDTTIKKTLIKTQEKGGSAQDTTLKKTREGGSKCLFKRPVRETLGKETKRGKSYPLKAALTGL